MPPKRRYRKKRPRKRLRRRAKRKYEPIMGNRIRSLVNRSLKNPVPERYECVFTSDISAYKAAGAYQFFTGNVMAYPRLPWSSVNLTRSLSAQATGGVGLADACTGFNVLMYTVGQGTGLYTSCTPISAKLQLTVAVGAIADGGTVVVCPYKNSEAKVFADTAAGAQLAAQAPLAKTSLVSVYQKAKITVPINIAKLFGLSSVYTSNDTGFSGSGALDPGNWPAFFIGYWNDQNSNLSTPLQIHARITIHCRLDGPITVSMI